MHFHISSFHSEGTERPEEEGLGERVAWGETGVHRGWTGFGSLERRAGMLQAVGVPWAKVRS